MQQKPHIKYIYQWHELNKVSQNATLICVYVCICHVIIRNTQCRKINLNRRFGSINNPINYTVIQRNRNIMCIVDNANQHASYSKLIHTTGAVNQTRLLCGC